MPDLGRWKRVLIKGTEVAVQIVAMASIDVYKLWHFLSKNIVKKSLRNEEKT